MRRKPFNTKWKSPSKGNLELSEIPEKILEYYNRMKMFNEHINITIGTDSQNFSFTKEVNVIAITCEHHGGIFFYKITSRDRINDVRQKLHTETQDSLEIADYLVNALTADEKYEELYSAFEKEYDVPENASTRDIFKIIDEVYPKSDDLEGTELREFLFKIAAEYGRALLKFHDGYKKWDEKQKALLFGRENSSVIRGQVINVLRYMFVAKKNGNHTDLLVNYSKYLTYSEKA